jgi:2-phosphosulfolactate phosphatase
LRLEVFLIPSELPESGLTGRAVAVIDVLRASSSIIAALEAGAKEVIPLASIEEATKLAETMGRETVILCGEREGNKINGFDLGNSPLEFTPEAVKGKSLLMSTTNGTVAVARAKGAALLAIAGFVNAGAAARLLASQNCDMALICSGKLGRASLEDILCAGCLVKLLSEQNGELELNDGARLSRDLYDKHKSRLPKVIKNSDHGAYLASLGYQADIEYSARIDGSQEAPIFKEGRIVKG